MSTSQVVAFVLFDIAVIVIVARLVGGLFQKVGQPRVMGEIVAGILLGPTILGATLWSSFAPPDWLACQDTILLAPPGSEITPTWCLFPAPARLVVGNIGQIALLLFSFLAGLEIDVGRVRRAARPVVVVGLGSVLVSVLLGLSIAPLLDSEVFRVRGASSLGFGLFVGAMLAVTALPVMVRILQEKGLTRSDMGIVGISSAAVTTIALFMTAAVAAAVASGESALAIGTKVGLMAAYLLGAVALVRGATTKSARRFEKTGEFSPELMALLFVTVALSGWFAEILGLTVVVGGFVAGLAMPHRVALHRAIDDRIGDVTATILLPIFLAFSGLLTDFTLLPASATGGLLLLVAVGILAKWPGTALLGRWSGLSWQESNVLGVLMNCRGLLVLVIGIEGVQNGVITPVMQLGAVTMALVTTAMTGPLFDRFNERGGRRAATGLEDA